MENFELMYDVPRNMFVHEPTGYLLSGDYVMIESNDVLREKIAAATGVQVDDDFLYVLRDTAYTMSHQPI